MTLRSLDLEALKATPVTREPFEYFVVPGFVRPEARAKINADYPKISEGGSFPVATLSSAGARPRSPFAVSAARRMAASIPIRKARSSRSSFT
jgi:hypothetical protein